jgi:lipid-binding SYLF domain-containing protein
LLTAVVLVLASGSWAADDAKDQSDVQQRIEKSALVLDEIMGTPDKAIPDKVMSDAKCIAVVPSMVRIAVGFGGSHGKGGCDLPDGERLERPGAHHDNGR